MWADKTELEADGALWLLVDGDLLASRAEGSYAEVVFMCINEYIGLFDAEGRVGVAKHVFLPGDGGAAIVAEELVAVRGIMSEAKFVIRFCEVPRAEVLVVWLAVALDRPCTPAWVDEFPAAVVNADDIPGMITVEGWEGCAGNWVCVANAFAMTRDDHGLKASVRSQSCEETGVAFADGHTSG